MRGIARNERAPVAIALGTQEMLRPFVHREHRYRRLEADGTLENIEHFVIAIGLSVKRPMVGAVLQDDEREERLHQMIMTSRTHRDVLEEFRTIKKRLSQFANVAFARKRNA